MSEFQNWFVKRKKMESTKSFHNFYGRRSPNYLLKFVIHSIFIMFKFLKFNFSYANQIKFTKKTIKLPSFPEEFNNFKILHISDTHFDLINGIENLIYNNIKNKEFDICFFTGDLTENSKFYKESLKKLVFAVRHTKFKYGIYSVLGNHDTIDLYKEYKKNKINILVNESKRIYSNGSCIIIHGTEDSSFFFDKNNLLKVNKDKSKFKIILSHTPELLDFFEERYFDLYCCGHTHGGQIILPFFKTPIFTGLCRFKDYYKGLKKYKNMLVHVSVGVGASIIPWRLNCEPEINILELRKN